MKRRGFTLVELLIVMFIIAVIAVVLLVGCGGLVWYFVKPSQPQSTSQPVQVEEVED